MEEKKWKRKKEETKRKTHEMLGETRQSITWKKAKSGGKMRRRRTGTRKKKVRGKKKGEERRVSGGPGHGGPGVMSAY